MNFKIILVIGASGMLGQAFYKLISKDYKFSKVIGVSRSGPDLNFDITSETEKLIQEIKVIKPDLIINCAAIVSIDECEKNFSKAIFINSEFVNQLSIFCSYTNCKLLQISTDHFYSDNGDFLHDENYPITLVNNYAKSKYFGEINALKNQNSIVIRTNITGYRYQENQPTFFEWLLKNIRNNEELVMFTDFYTSTIDSFSLAKMSLRLAMAEECGIFNIGSCDCISKYEFSLRLAEELQISTDRIKSGSIKSITPIRANSLGLDCSKTSNILKVKMPNTTQVIKNLLSQEKN